MSAADLRAEKILKGELAKARPDFGFLMEESGGQAGRGDDTDRRWIVDPLDGTTNFLHGLPHFAISIALEERGEIVAAYVFDPIKDERFHAEKGKGAYLNDRRLRVSARSRLDEVLLATGIPFKGRGDHAVFQRELAAVMEVTAGVRRWGTAALDLAYVAAGRYDGFWERDLSPGTRRRASCWCARPEATSARSTVGVTSPADPRSLPPIRKSTSHCRS